jgi:E3 ubiquitin-protein ligase RNF213
LRGVQVVSYQGSPSSTSEGVLQTFQTAKSYAESADARTTTVVLIDEVGLAEISPFNPLKVLHSLLEASDFEAESEVAVVAISNWTLDAAKMNRAIMISRPEPDGEQLRATGRAIAESLAVPASEGTPMDALLGRLADAYCAYCADQLLSRQFQNFHGLRDLYSTVKQVAALHAGRAAGLPVDPAAAALAIARNFGGLEATRANALTDLLDSLGGVGGHGGGRGGQHQQARALVEANLRDRECRHLMLLTTGDAILSALDGLFKDCGLASPRVFIGSRLKGDQSESYHYRVLSGERQSRAVWPA